MRGDIAAQSADALVNAAGTSLRMGSGVAGALREAAGPELEAVAREEGPIRPGEVAVTDAYDLDADYVLHAAVVRHGGVSERATGARVRRATTCALAAADERGCRSIALPILGAGNGGLYDREAADVLLEVVDRYEPTSLEIARLVAYSARARNALAAAAEELT